MTVHDIMTQAKSLSQQEQKELIKLLVDALAVTDVRESELPKRYRLSALRGLGADIWRGIDAQDYVNELRDEWDQPQ
ncbi:MAG: hypothetical protein JXA10_17915 [Anaerolineae bacterium]|nr:hypothetical protein [Anaerolineae bacterium]